VNLEILTSNQKITVFIGMAIYMIAMISIGLYYAKKNKSSEDFFLGGRTLGPWVAAMSAEASDMSSWLLMGLPGLAYVSGYANAGWTAIGLAVGTYLNWKIVSRRLRSYTIIADNAITIPDFFSNRFHDKKKILMSISAIIIFVFFTIYTSSGFVACGKLFVSLFDYDYTKMMLLSALVVVLYTAVGGFLAESMTDFVQGLLMFFALIAVMIVGTAEAGGIGKITEIIGNMDGFTSLLSAHDRATGEAVNLGFIDILSTLAWGLGYFGMPHILLRFMALKDPKEMKKSRVIACTWCFISLAVAVLIGVIGVAAVPNLLEGAKNAKEITSNSETIFIVMTQIFGKKALPLTILAGIILSAILAATMSTSDSQLLVTSSAIAQNFYKGVIKKDATDEQILFVSRITIVIVTIFGAILALDPDSSVFDMVSNAWAGFGAAFGPLVLFSLFWKRTTLQGAVAGMIGGGGMVLIWKYWLSNLGGIFKIYELLPAFIFSAILIVVVSLCTKAPDESIIEEFERAKELA